MGGSVLDGLPHSGQLFVVIITCIAFWLYGRWWHHGTRGLYLPHEVSFPQWFYWLSAEFDTSVGLNPYAVLLQVPSFLVVPLFIALYNHCC